MGVQPENFSSYNFQHEDYRLSWLSLGSSSQQDVSLLPASDFYKNVKAVNVFRILHLAVDLTLQLPMELLDKDVKTVNVTRSRHSVWISPTVSPTPSGILQAPTPTLGLFRDARDLTVNRKLLLEERREPLSLNKNTRAVRVTIMLLAMASRR